MLPDRVSNPGPLTYESGALRIALRGPATEWVRKLLSTSLILKKFSCGKVQIPCLHQQQNKIKVSYVMRCIFLHNPKQRLPVFAQGCVEKYSVHNNSS